jgi:PhnB protein
MEVEMKELNPYITFNGNTRQAMQFYQSCLGGELHLIPFAESPMQVPPEAKEKIMHGKLVSGPVTIMASDPMPGQTTNVASNIALFINCESLDEIKRLFTALGTNGKITIPLQDTFWGAHFGMVTDQFGTHWMFSLDK